MVSWPKAQVKWSCMNLSRFRTVLCPLMVQLPIIVVIINAIARLRLTSAFFSLQLFLVYVRLLEIYFFRILILLHLDLIHLMSQTGSNWQVFVEHIECNLLVILHDADLG